MKQSKTLSILVRIAAGLLLLFALGDMAYSYYLFLRIAICVGSIFLIWYFVSAKIEWLGWFFVIPAILFNPIVPIYMDKSIWQTIDFVFALFFFASLFAIGKEKRIK